MNKRRYWSGLLLLTLIFTFSVSAGAASKKTKALNAYADMLAAMPKTVQFTTATVDNNTVPELFVLDPAGFYTMYRWTGTEIAGVQFGDERVESYGAVLGVYSRKSLIMMRDTHGLVTYASYAKGDLTPYLHMDMLNDIDHYYDVIDYVTDEISFKKFNAMLGQKIGKTKMTELTYVTNTASHRKSRLKKKGTAVSLTLNNSSLVLTAGKTKKLKATLKGSKAKIKWSSSDKTVATVSSKGKVKGVDAGKCLITASAGKISVSCRVKIKAKKLFPEVSEVRLIRKYDSSSKVWYVLEGVGENGKAVWTYTTSGVSYTPAQYDQVQFIETDRYVYYYENGYFVKLERETGEALRISQKIEMGPPSLYVDSYGSLFAVPFDGESKMYMLNSSLVLLRTQEFLLSETIMERVIRGRIGNYLIISSEGSDAAAAVYLY